MRKVFCIVMLFAAWHSVLAKEYRVSTAAQLTSAITSVVPGDTITMLNGTWTNITVTFKAQGTPNAKILLRAQTRGMVLLTGKSSLKIAGTHLTVDGLTFRDGYVSSGNVIEFRGDVSPTSYCRLTNTSVIDYSNPDTTVDSKWVSLYGDHNRVDHCYFRGKRNLGTTLVVWLSATPNYHLIDHNYFAYRPPLGMNGGETIRVGTSEWSLYDSYTTVEYNYFEQCNGESEIISNKSCGNVYRYNTFVSCEGALTLRHGNRATVEGNFFFGNRKPNTGGIRIIGEDHVVINNYISGTTGSEYRAALTFMNGLPNTPLNGYYQVKRAKVVNNTLVDNDFPVHMGLENDPAQNLPPLDCVFANTIVYGTRAPLITFQYQPINMQWSNNIFYGASMGFSTLPAGNFYTNPLFELPDTSGIKRIKSYSPAVNAALKDFPFVTLDADGQLRDSLPDIGSDEYSSLPVTIRPLRPQDVGPGSEPVEVRGQKNTGALPQSPCIIRSYPNPFNPSTLISYDLPVDGYMRLSLHSSTGAKIAELAAGYQKGGPHSLTLNASRYNLSSGLYLAELCFGGRIYTHKIVLLK